MNKWHVYVKGGYIASTLATLAEIKAAFPYAVIVGNSVNVWGM
jgi:hypothetical protein